MTKLDQLKQIIEVALQGNVKSKLTDEVINSVGGFTSPNIRNLLNNLGAISEHYLECGSHVGATLISTVYANDNLKSAIGIDNFSLFDASHNSKNDFLAHCDRHIPGRYKLIEKDYFEVIKKEIGKPIDLYLFDGDHSYESQKKGITYYSKFFAKETIVCVDDFAWPEPYNGTMDGLKEANLNVVYNMNFYNGIASDCGGQGWWNGFGVFLITK